MGCIWSSLNCITEPTNNNNTVKVKDLSRAEIIMTLYTCELCGQDSLTESDMRTHLLLEHIEGSITCPFCHFGGVSLDDINVHIDSVHREQLALSSKQNATTVNQNGRQMFGVECRNKENVQPVCVGFPPQKIKAQDKSPRSAIPYSPPSVPPEFLQSILQPSNQQETRKPSNASKQSHSVSSRTSSVSSVSSVHSSKNNAGTTDMYHVISSDTSDEGMETSCLLRHKRLVSESDPISCDESAADCTNTTHINLSNSIDSINRSSSDLFDDHLSVDTSHRMQRLSSESKENLYISATSLTSRNSRMEGCETAGKLASPCSGTATGGITKSNSECKKDCMYNCKSCVAEVTALVNSSAMRANGVDNLMLDSDMDCEEFNDGKDRSDEHDASDQVSTSRMECPLCEFETMDYSTLQSHVDTQHTELLSISESVHTCPMCDVSFTDTQQLTHHVEDHFNGDNSSVTDRERSDSLLARELSEQSDALLAEQTAREQREQQDSLLAQELSRKELDALQEREQQEFLKLQETYGMDCKTTYRQQAERCLNRAMCNGSLSLHEYHNHRVEIQQSALSGVDDGHSATRGIINKLRTYYNSPKCSVRTAYLCTTDCTHYSVSYGDRGWGCGYRNLQMLLSSLTKHPGYKETLFNGRPLIPAIPKIQTLIEAAWKKGFDVAGCEQLGGQVVNTAKWIGATEIVALLASLKVKCKLMDFHAPTHKDGTHPALFRWVKDYFSSEQQHKPPLYLQHQGHSRTVVGIEELKDSTLRLLLFDPSSNTRQMDALLAHVKPQTLRSIRRSVSAMKAEQYQIVMIDHIISTDVEYEDSKVISSERIP